MKRQHIKDLLYQSLETERAAADIYAAAIRCAHSKELRKEWESSLAAAEENKRALKKVLKKLDLDPGKKTPVRRIVAHLGDSLVTAMNMARKAGDKKGAEGVASECVVFIESKHEFNWALMAELAAAGDESEEQALKSIPAAGRPSSGESKEDLGKSTKKKHKLPKSKNDKKTSAKDAVMNAETDPETEEVAKPKRSSKPGKVKPSGSSSRAKSSSTGKASSGDSAVASGKGVRA